MSGAPVGKDKSGSRASASKGAGCRQTRAVEEGKDEGGVGTEGGRNKRAGCMGGGIRALGGTRRMG